MLANMSESCPASSAVARTEERPPELDLRVASTSASSSKDQSDVLRLLEVYKIDKGIRPNFTKRKFKLKGDESEVSADTCRDEVAVVEEVSGQMAVMVAAVFSGFGRYGTTLSMSCALLLPAALRSALQAAEKDTWEVEELMQLVVSNLDLKLRELEEWKAGDSGCTAVFVMLTNQPFFVCAGTVGDCLPVLCRRNPDEGAECVPLGAAAVPDQPWERARLERAGACVVKVRGKGSKDQDSQSSSHLMCRPGALNAGLPFARCLGCFSFRDLGLISEPTCCALPRHDSDHLILLGSPGLWKGWSPSQAVDFLGRYAEQRDMELSFADALTLEAQRRALRDDVARPSVPDVAAIVISLKRLPSANRHGMIRNFPRAALSNVEAGAHLSHETSVQLLSDESENWFDHLYREEANLVPWKELTINNSRHMTSALTTTNSVAGHPDLASTTSLKSVNATTSSDGSNVTLQSLTARHKTSADGFRELREQNDAESRSMDTERLAEIANERNFRVHKVRPNGPLDYDAGNVTSSPSISSAQSIPASLVVGQFTKNGSWGSHPSPVISPEEEHQLAAERIFEYNLREGTSTRSTSNSPSFMQSRTGVRSLREALVSSGAGRHSYLPDPYPSAEMHGRQSAKPGGTLQEYLTSTPFMTVQAKAGGNGLSRMYSLEHSLAYGGDATQYQDVGSKAAMSSRQSSQRIHRMVQHSMENIETVDQFQRTWSDRSEPRVHGGSVRRHLSTSALMFGRPRRSTHFHARQNGLESLLRCKSLEDLTSRYSKSRPSDVPFKEKDRKVHGGSSAQSLASGFLNSADDLEGLGLSNTEKDSLHPYPVSSFPKQFPLELAHLVEVDPESDMTPSHRMNQGEHVYDNVNDKSPYPSIRTSLDTSVDDIDVVTKYHPLPRLNSQNKRPAFKSLYYLSAESPLSESNEGMESRQIGGNSFITYLAATASGRMSAQGFEKACASPVQHVADEPVKAAATGVRYSRSSPCLLATHEEGAEAAQEEGSGHGP